MQKTGQRLVLQARLGDRDAYGELVARHQGRVRGWLRHLCGDHAEADDLAQEAFVRAWTRLGDLKDAARFPAWLMKIAYNEFLQSRRSSDRRNRMMERFELNQKALKGEAPADAPESALELQQVLSIMSEKRTRRRGVELCLRLLARRGERTDRASAGHGQIADPPRQRARQGSSSMHKPENKQANDRELAALFAATETPPESDEQFVAGVMSQIRRRERMRWWVLGGSALLASVFGLPAAWELLSAWNGVDA